MDHLTSDSPTVASSHPGVGTALAGRYRIRERLGRGASKEVYLAYDERLDREVAVAIVVGAGVSDAARTRTAREAQVTGRLGDHPNVITVYDTGELDGVPYLVLRAMRGGSLADRLERERPTVDAAIRIGSEIATALAHAHAHGVVHRDVKPDNVWLGDDGRAALGDFGVAFRPDQERLTAEGVIVGTVRYLSPEQIRGDGVGPASDLYALGVTLYEMLAGRPPFAGPDASRVLAQHLTATPAPPSAGATTAVPPTLEGLVLELLAKDVADRPASAAEVAARLARVSASASRTADRPDARRLVAVLMARAAVDDPEIMRDRFDRAAAVVDEHGGSAEPTLGDAMAGFFGLAGASGDEALRAARAAVALRASTDELRLGVELGEVFVRAGTPTGAAIGAAGRLAEQAAPGEILVGPRLRELLAPRADIDPATHRLLELRADPPGRPDAPPTAFAGREAEHALLLADLRTARSERSCRLVTILGPPGIGKSRLAAELMRTAADEATVLVGRCRAHGEGTAYRALSEIVLGLGDDPGRRVEALLEGGPAARSLLAAIGLAEGPVQPEATAWALRRLLERLARERPVILTVEDVHWAAPVFMDILDHVATLSSGAAILIVCVARPELVESRPTWVAPRPTHRIITLDALPEADSRRLAEQLGAGPRATSIARRAEGNPLFVEQLVAVDSGQDTLELPASIHAVLAARIDALDQPEQTLLGHAAVEGRTFNAGPLAVASSGDAPGAVGARLVALVRKGLIEPDRPQFDGEEAFRFTHALIRDVAYAGLPKRSRGRLHAAVAGWLDQRPTAADEVVGFHLEQVCRLGAELGDPAEPDLTRRAADRLTRAAQTARLHGVPQHAATLLERALALLDTADVAYARLLAPLGVARFEAGHSTAAAQVLDVAIGRAEDPRVRARAQLEREIVRLGVETSGDAERSRRVADAVLPLLERCGDDHGQARAWFLRAFVDWIRGQVAAADAAWTRADECARRAGDERERIDVAGWRATAAVLGPTPVDEAIRRCEGLRELVGASPVAVAWILNPLASLHAMRGDSGLADRLLGEADEILDALGSRGASVSHHGALVALVAGDPARAEAPLRASLDVLVEMDDADGLATTRAMLAQVVYAVGRPREAAELCREAASSAAADDTVTQAIWRGVEAKVLAGDGDCARALALAREGVSLLEPTDLLSHQGDALLDLAEVLRRCARTQEADGAVRRAVALYERKGNVAVARRARALLTDASSTDEQRGGDHGVQIELHDGAA